MDTIVAITTALGSSSVGMVRLSGEKSTEIAQQICGKLPTPRFAKFSHFKDQNGEIIDSGIVLFFPAPHSFTGEDVVELQGHGNPFILNILCQHAILLGAKMAEPGEFSKRAFLNEKIDLTQAEAIADLINSKTEQAARGAFQSLQGVFSKQINQLLLQLTELRKFVESAIDFSDEDINFLEDKSIKQQLQALLTTIDGISRSAKQGRLMQAGINVVLVGQPNVGKSSLHNQLAGHNAAIVTDIAGTTRDILREHIHLDGMPLRISDTAGLHNSNNKIEQEGIRRTQNELSAADHILLLIDDKQGITDKDKNIQSMLPADIPFTIIHNKIDQSGQRPSLAHRHDIAHVYLSAKTGAGIALLKKHLCASMNYHPSDENIFVARHRHLDALDRVRSAVETGYHCLTNMGAVELLAEELKLAQQALGEITGTFTNESLLDEIFASFCIGK